MNRTLAELKCKMEERPRLKYCELFVESVAVRGVTANNINSLGVLRKFNSTRIFLPCLKSKGESHLADLQRVFSSRHF